MGGSMDVFFARQPIFDTRSEVVGYELLYRRTPESLTAVGEGRVMASRVLVDAVLGMGLEVVTGSVPAYVNLPRELLVGGAADLLDPKRVVIEVLETVEADAEVMRACEQLVRRGYTLALDDYVVGDVRAPLLPHVSIVKVDVLAVASEQLQGLVTDVRGGGKRLLAEKVEDEAMLRRCASLDFDLFQGFFFRRPQMVEGRDLSVEQFRIIELMDLLGEQETPADVIIDAFRADPGLSYKLLAMANSVAMGGRGIESIAHALRLLGRERLYRWMALLFVASSRIETGRDAELLRETLLRARLCEAVGESGARREEAGPLFLVGLFSRLDALLGMPLPAILSRVKLSPAVVRALLEREGPYAVALELVDAYERGNWDRVSEIAVAAGFEVERVGELYAEAIDWMKSRLALL